MCFSQRGGVIDSIVKFYCKQNLLRNSIHVQIRSQRRLQQVPAAVNAYQLFALGDTSALAGPFKHKRLPGDQLLFVAIVYFVLCATTMRFAVACRPSPSLAQLAASFCPRGKFQGGEQFSRGRLRSDAAILLEVRNNLGFDEDTTIYEHLLAF